MVRSISAVFITLSSCIAEGNSGKVNVTVGICPDVAEETRAATFVTGCSEFVAAGSGVAGEEFDKKHG